MNYIQRFVEYIKYRRKAKDKHGIHSPFLFKFLTEVIEDKKRYPAYIEIEDYWNKNEENCSFNKQFYFELYRISKKYRFDHVLEIGNSLDIARKTLELSNSDIKIHQFDDFNSITKELNIIFEEIRKPFDLIIIHQTENKALHHIIEELLDKVSNEGFIIINNIHQNNESEGIWTEITKLREATFSVDMFNYGFLIKKERTRKQHFVLKH